MTQKKKKETKDAEGFIEIPLGAFDSETMGWTYTIPEGFTAKIEDGKIIVEKKESDDKQIIDALAKRIQDMYDNETAIYEGVQVSDILAWLEKQKDAETEIEKAYKNADKIQYEKGFEDGIASVKPAEWSEEDEQWLEAIIKDYENSLTKDKDHAAVIKIEIDFLKSLPERFSPQPHWKPSEEQRHIEGQDTCYLNKQKLVNFIEDCIAENLENTTQENRDNHEGYHQACWDILYFIKQASK